MTPWRVMLLIDAISIHFTSFAPHTSTSVISREDWRMKYPAGQERFDLSELDTKIISGLEDCKITDGRNPGGSPRQTPVLTRPLRLEVFVSPQQCRFPNSTRTQALHPPIDSKCKWSATLTLNYHLMRTATLALHTLHVTLHILTINHPF
jgi:hypothetical protein